jgi:hypothetical protein
MGLWVLRPLTGLLYQPRMIGDGDCGEIGGIKIGRRNRSSRRKPAPAPLCHHKSHVTRPGAEVYLHAFSTSTLGLCEWLVSRSDVFVLGLDLEISLVVGRETRWAPGPIQVYWWRRETYPYSNRESNTGHLARIQSTY